MVFFRIAFPLFTLFHKAMSFVFYDINSQNYKFKKQLQDKIYGFQVTPYTFYYVYMHMFSIKHFILSYYT